MRLIDAKKLLDFLDETVAGEDLLVSRYSADWIYSFLESAPIIDAEPVRHGRWVRSILAEDFNRCSECYSVWNREFEYCPHCGAKMDGKETE